MKYCRILIVPNFTIVIDGDGIANDDTLHKPSNSHGDEQIMAKHSKVPKRKKTGIVATRPLWKRHYSSSILLYHFDYTKWRIARFYQACVPINADRWSLDKRDYGRMAYRVKLKG